MPCADEVADADAFASLGGALKWLGCALNPGGVWVFGGIVDDDADAVADAVLCADEMANGDAFAALGGALKWLGGAFGGALGGAIGGAFGGAFGGGGGRPARASCSARAFCSF